MISDNTKKYITYAVMIIFTAVGTATGVNYFELGCKPSQEAVVTEKQGTLIFDNLRISELTTEALYTVFELKQQVKDQDKFNLIINSPISKDLINKLTTDRLNFMQKHSIERNKTHREGKMSFYVDAYYNVQNQLINTYLIDNIDSLNVDDNINDLMNENIETLVELKAKELKNKNGKK